MVEISLSGSGGGCGRVTSRSYPTRCRRLRAMHVVAFHHERSAMGRGVASRASKVQIRRIVRATVRTMDDVMNLEPTGRATSGRLASTTIAAPHEAPDTRWDVLRRAHRRRV